ncbi:MAG: AAA family ATPase [Treponema sp.]|jgi:MoxR-like ATPase|nr:AAA family ATPase [Treponema sp.]
MQVEEVADTLITGITRVIQAQRETLELLVSALFARGHILLEDNPGLGKTTLAKTIAALIAGAHGNTLQFKRVQFTPDLLPYDITGVDVFDPDSHAFHFVEGPVFAHIVLADEINRTTPKVQSALLEVMAERQVTIGTNTHILPQPFIVVATQNPIESEGTFPLPAAQLDRFMIRLSLGYPSREAELRIVAQNPGENMLDMLKPIITVEDILQTQHAAQVLFCHPTLQEVIVDIVRDTRTHEALLFGASPRAALHLLAAARAHALTRGADFVTDLDIAKLAIPVLAHRLKVRNPRTRPETIVQEICYERLNHIKAL